jgi:hypothetical protein
MSNIHRAAVALVAYGVLLGTAGGAPPEKAKGRLRGTTTTPVTLDKDGAPVGGGKEGLVIQPKADGILLAVTVREAGAGAPAYQYLAYPVEKGAPARLRVVSKPGPGCYWTERRIPAGKDDCEGHIWEMDIYSVKEGPLKGLELRRDKQSLVLVESTAPVRKSYPKDSYVGRLFDYDNLDDGK